MFKKIVFLTTFFLSMFLVFSFNFSQANEQEEINLYFFSDTNCAHCRQLEEFIEEEILDEYDIKYTIIYTDKDEDYDFKFEEITYNWEVWDLIDVMLEEYPDFAKTPSDASRSVPTVSIGGKLYVGSNPTVKAGIYSAVERYTSGESEYIDVGQKIIRGDNLTNEYFDDTVDGIFIPFLGDAADLPILAITIVMGIVDGFNPCALWVLLFLITLLITTGDRKKMWVLGSTFLFASGVFYFLVMVAWFNVINEFVDYGLFQLAIGIFAIAVGLISLKKFIKGIINKDEGCDVVDDKRRTKLMNRIRKVINSKNYFLAIIGIIVVAVIVNFIELACSAGLPALYTFILATNGITGVSAFLWILLYVFFFLLDGLIIFSIATITMKVTSIGNKYVKYSFLIGGLLMLFLGISLLFFPELLSFGF